MTCKDCLCCDVCVYLHDTESVDFEEINPLACDHFKPKSRFVELSCEETIMYVKDNWLMLNMESEHLGEAIKRCVDYLTKNARDRE